MSVEVAALEPDSSPFCQLVILSNIFSSARKTTAVWSSSGFVHGCSVDKEGSQHCLELKPVFFVNVYISFGVSEVQTHDELLYSSCRLQASFSFLSHRRRRANWRVRFLPWASCYVFACKVKHLAQVFLLLLNYFLCLLCQFTFKCTYTKVFLDY